MVITTFPLLHCVWLRGAANRAAAHGSSPMNVVSDRPARAAFSIQQVAEQPGVCPASVYRALKR